MTKRLRINFGISDFLREWIKVQPNVVGILEESITHVVVYHNMDSTQLAAFKQGVVNMLGEDLSDV